MEEVLVNLYLTGGFIALENYYLDSLQEIDGNPIRNFEELQDASRWASNTVKEIEKYLKA